jgi:DnaJ-class molecular chaperone
MYSTFCTGVEDPFGVTRGPSCGGCIVANVNLKTLWIRCPWCEGNGTMIGTPAQPCKFCRGEGGILKKSGDVIVELVKHATRGH